MRRKRSTRKTGFPPESLIYTGDIKVDSNHIQLIRFNEVEFQQFESKSFEELTEVIKPGNVNWINTNKMYDIVLIEQIGRYFDIHYLILEDILNSEQLPKSETTDQHIYFTLKHLSFSRKDYDIVSSHISFILGVKKNIPYLISFCDTQTDIFHRIVEHLKASQANIRRRGADYLLYMLIDAVIDHYYIVFDEIQEWIESIEAELMSTKSPNRIQDIYQIKRILSSTRKTIFPLSEASDQLILQQSAHIKSANIPYFRDLDDHIVQLTDIYETSREMISGLIDLNFSNISTSLGSVMKTLTIVSSIFIPLTFLVGVYGMNFKFMPEIQWEWGYPLVLFLMISIATVMLIIFKKKKWF